MENNNFERRGFRTRSSRDRARRVCGKVGIGIVVGFLIALVFGLLVKWFWNWLVPDIFGLGTITFWQAFGLVILTKLLFGGFIPHGRFKHHPKTGYYHDRLQGWDDRESDDPDDENSRHCPFDRWSRYGRYWREKGRDDFNRYANGVEKQGSETNSPTEPESDQ
jgi:hypothetical protein